MDYRQLAEEARRAHEDARGALNRTKRLLEFGWGIKPVLAHENIQQAHRWISMPVDNLDLANALYWREAERKDEDGR